MKKQDGHCISFDIRYSRNEDLPFLRRWMREPEVSRFLLIEKEDVEVFSKNWIGFARYSSSLTLTKQEEPIGIATLFLMPYLKLTHHSSVCYILDPQAQKEEVAPLLIQNINHLGKNYFHFEKIYFETFEKDPLLPWFIEEGYAEIARQNSYVKEANERCLDRLILEKNFEQ